MSIRKKILIFFTILSTTMFSLFVDLWFMLKTSGELTHLEEQRFNSHALAEELRRSSDDLTRMARTYAATGDIRFKNYFQTIVDIRDGKVPRPQDYNYIFWDFVTATHKIPLQRERKFRSFG